MGYDYVGLIRSELLRKMADAPKSESKNLYLEAVLEGMFGQHDWTRSFHTPQVLEYREVVPSEVLIIIHRWLRRKCANIENIRLVINHHTGVQKWWTEWCDLHQEKSFAIKELFHTSVLRRRPCYQDMAALPCVDWYKQHKMIANVFSFFGGMHAKLDRLYLLLKVLGLNHIAEIEYKGKFYPKQQILDYAENILFFTNQKEIDYLAATYDNYVDNDMTLRSDRIRLPAVLDEPFKFNGPQWEIDRHCWASVVRETINDDVYSCVTEKTVRAFLHHVAVIPVGYRAVRDLEHLGFWFPHDIVDYSYQDCKPFSERIGRLIDTLQKLSNQWSLQELEVFYFTNIEHFQHNANLVYELFDTPDSYL